MKKLLLFTLLCLCGCASFNNIDTEQESQDPQDPQDQTTTTSDYSDSEYLYLNQEYESWSSILLSKDGDSFFVQSEDGVAKTLLFADSDFQNTAYVEFDDEQYPSLMVVGDVTFVFSNYRDNLVDIALIDSDYEIYTYCDVECDLGDFESNTDEVASILLNITSVTYVANNIDTEGIATVANAVLTACSMFVDSSDIWIAPSSDDMSTAVTDFGFGTLSSISNSASLALDVATDFIAENMTTIQSAKDKLAGEEEEMIDAEYTVNITVGDIVSSDESSATCELQGVLEAVANDGEFDFNYGICYSTNPTPTINDQIITLSCISSDSLTSISVFLPITMTMKDLETDVTYYYRAFFEDNITEDVTYGDDVKEFTLESVEDSERSILEQIYYATGGENWTNNSNWCTDAPLSEWYGVTVSDETEGVMWLSLDENNLIGDLDVNGLSSLSMLSCSSNQLTTLNVSECSSLSSLTCNSNQLTTLNVSGCSSLMWLHCYSNQLTILNLRGLNSLTYLYCFYNQLTTLDVSEYSSLSVLWCYDNQLTSLNVSGCSSLSDLRCYDNLLTTLDLHGYSSLSALRCHRNGLTTLDVSGCSSLDILYCYTNELTTLNVSGCSSLSGLLCYDNNLTAIYLSSTPSTFSYTSWGDYDEDLYTEPSYMKGYQYPQFFYE